MLKIGRNPASAGRFPAALLTAACLALLSGCQTTRPGAGPAALKGAGNASAAASETSEGLEVRTEWRVRDWGNPMRYMVIDDPKDSRNDIGRLSFISGEKDKSAISLNPSADFSNVAAIGFDVYNGSDRPVKVALALKTLPDYDYYESPPEQVRPRKWRRGCRVALAANTFKSEATNWEHKAAIKDVAKTYQVLFLVYFDCPAGFIGLDNVRLVPAEQGKSSEK